MDAGHVAVWEVGPPPERCSFCKAQRTDELRMVAVYDGAAAVCEDCIARFVELLGGWEEREPRQPIPASELLRDYREKLKRPPLDPRDLGPPILVQLNGEPLGDLGNARVDARLLLAILLRKGPIADWLSEHGIQEAVLREAFGGMDLGFEPPT